MNATLLGGPDCGKRINALFVEIVLSCGSYINSRQLSKDGLMIYRWEQKGGLK